MSTTTNLKLFKHDNPTANTNQFNVEKSLNENWDKLDANAGEIANKIQQLNEKGILDGSVTPEKTSFVKDESTVNLYDYKTNTSVNLIMVTDVAQSTAGTLVAHNSYKSLILEVKPNTIYTIEKSLGARFRVCATTERPAVGVAFNQHIYNDGGDKIEITTGEQDNYLLVAFYNTSVDTGLTEEEVRTTIKAYEGTEWVENKLFIDGLLVNENNTSFLKENEDETYNFKKLKNEFSNLSDEMLRLLSYRQLGELDSGYLCFIADDGAMTLSNTIFPILKEKRVPCTFALMSNSPIMNTNTGDIEGLKQMINDYKCSVCQHGLTSYDSYSDEELINYLKAQQEYWKNLNITVKGLVYPNHSRNNKIRTICGSMYDICCAGIGNRGNYEYNLNGTRSNSFDLSRISLVSSEELNQAVDYAIANKKLMIVYWHDNTIAEDTTYIEKLRNFIDYAKTSGIEIITLDAVMNL